MQWESMEKQLNSSGNIFQAFHHCLFFKRSKKTWRERTFSPKNSKTGSSSCQCSMTLIGKKHDENCISNAEKVKNDALKFSQGHWTYLGRGSEEQWYGSSSYDQQREWDSAANNMVQRFRETGHPVFKSISALRRGILKQKKGKSTIHFNGDSTNTELLFQTAPYLRSTGELVTSIRFDTGRKRDEPIYLWTTRCWHMYNWKKYNS